MTTATLSPKYQVVIPQPVREKMGLRSGEKMQIFALDGRIEIIPVRPAKAFFGFLKVADLSLERDEDRL